MSDHDPFEDLARNAGAELRQAAPEGGLARLHHSRRRRQVATIAATGATAMILVVGAVVVAGRGDDHTTEGPVDSAAVIPTTVGASSSTVSTAPTTSPTESSGPTTTAPATSPPTLGPSTTADPAPPVSTPGVTASTSPSGVFSPPTGAPTTQVAVSFVGGSAAPWAPIGWWDGSRWVDSDPALAPPESPIDSVTALGPGLPEGPVTGLHLGRADTYCSGAELGREIDLGRVLPDGPPYLGWPALAVTADWNVQPRPVAPAGIDSPVYQQVGESLVADRPDVDPTLGDVTEVYRADLDGDGIEEVVFGFEHITDTAGIGAAGDFSLVIARIPHADGSVQDQVLFEHYPEDPVTFPTPGRASVLAIADLNGDGVMEVVTRSVVWEGRGADAYALQAGRLERVLSGGCGS